MELRFAAYNGIADTAIKDLIDLVGPVRHRSIVREMIIAALKAGQENPQMADLKIMCGTLKEMRYTSKVFGAYRNARKITVFGSGTDDTGQPAIPDGRGFRPQTCRRRLHGDHRRRPGNHVCRQRGRRP